MQYVFERPLTATPPHYFLFTALDFVALCFQPLLLTICTGKGLELAVTSGLSLNTVVVSRIGNPVKENSQLQ